MAKMYNDLPEFDRSRKHHVVQGYIRRVFSQGSDTALRDLITYDDGHYRATFSPDYFVIQEGKTDPSKSQWNTLKKRMKRIDRQVFIFRNHGKTKDGLYYIDFGFFLD